MSGFPEELQALLRKHASLLHPDIRMVRNWAWSDSHVMFECGSEFIFSPSDSLQRFDSAEKQKCNRVSEVSAERMREKRVV